MEKKLPTIRFQPRTKALFPGILGSLMISFGLFTVRLVSAGEMPTSSLIFSAVVLLTGIWVLSIAVRRPPVFEIAEGEFVLGKLRIPMRSIRQAEIRRIWGNGGSGRFLELRFERMPSLPFIWRIHQFATRLPPQNWNGFSMPPEPSLLIPIAETDTSDHEIEEAFKFLKDELDDIEPSFSL